MLCILEMSYLRWKVTGIKGTRLPMTVNILEESPLALNEQKPPSNRTDGD